MIRLYVGATTRLATLVSLLALVLIISFIRRDCNIASRASIWLPHIIYELYQCLASPQNTSAEADYSCVKAHYSE